MSLLDKEPVKRAEKSLKDFDQSLEVIVLDKSARTAQDAATALDCNVGAIVKSLLFKTEDSFILCLVAGDKRASLNKIKKIINKKDVSMASSRGRKISNRIYNWWCITYWSFKANRNYYRQFFRKV